MNIVITPKKLCGSVTPPPSKSHTHRLLIAAALADMPVHAPADAVSDDISATVRCLRALQEQQPLCDCGESGSTLRFLTPVAAALHGARFTGSERLSERPIEPLLSLLRDHGCTISEDKLPFTVSGGLQSGVYALRGDVSSQFVTGLLFALPLLDGSSEIVLTTPLQSRGYVDMTLQVLAQFGIEILEKDSGFLIPGGQRYTAPQEKPIPEGDWSGAAFWYGVNACGGSVKVNGLNGPSAQGDSVVASLAQTLPDVIATGNIPDLVPVLSIMACKKAGDTHFVNAQRLRLKESDRLEACVQMILALGGSAENTQDTLTVHGNGCLRGGTVNGMNDHRIVMSAAVASCLCTEPVTITDANAVNKSYPAFWQDFEQLGGSIHVL